MKKLFLFGIFSMAFALVGAKTAFAEDAVITGVTPTIGPVGTEVTIAGENFGDESCLEEGTCELYVYFDDAKLSAEDDATWTDTEISARVPDSVEPGEISIRLEREGSGNEDFDITADQTFTVTSEEDSPAITSMSASNLAPGDFVSIHGQNLNDGCYDKGTLECQAQVYIGDELAVDFQNDVEGLSQGWSDNALTIEIPEGIESGVVRVYRSEIFNYGEDDAYAETYDITGEELTIHENNTEAERAEEILDLEDEADAYDPGDGGFATSFESITEALGITNLSQSDSAEAQAEELLDEIYGDFSAIVGGFDNQYSYIFFVGYNDIGTTAALGAGERAGALNSWRSAFDKTVPANALEWEDILKIANGRWPSQRNSDQEVEASEIFERIYLRNPNRDNANDDAAVITIAYGLRPEPRNTDSERQAIGFFQAIFGYSPASALDWDVVRAIAYSGATR